VAQTFSFSLVSNGRLQSLDVVKPGEDNGSPIAGQAGMRCMVSGKIAFSCDECLQFYIVFVTIMEQIDTT
jgi:hypothetical protein